MTWDILVARWVHIIAGIIWTGTGFSIALWWGPASIKAGQAGEDYWRTLVHRTPFVKGMNVLTLLTVIAGLYLYWRLEYLERLSLASGVVLTIGAAAGLGLAALTPMHTILTKRVWTLRDAAGPTPSPEDQEKISAVGRDFIKLDVVNFIFGFVALTAMATARYW